MRILFLFLYGASNEYNLDSILISLLHGIRFDLATIAYFLLPIWMVCTLFFWPITKGKFDYFIKIFLIFYSLLIFSITLIIIIADIGFYNEFFNRINYIAFEYLDTIDVIIGSILVQTPYNLLLFFSILIIIILNYYLYKFLYTISFSSLNISIYKWFKSSIFSLLLLVAMIRGGFQEIPLNFANSNISKFRFLNQLVLNPVWNLGYSYSSAIKDESISRLASIPISINESINQIRNNLLENNSKFLKHDYPLLRKTISDNPINQYNVIIILMESFAGKYIGALGNKLNITPEFDKLASEGMLFSRMFSTGSRTNRGMAGTLLSFPAIPKYESIFKDYSVSQEFSSLARILNQRDYKSNFIFSGDLSYDNMKEFLSKQGYDKFFGKKEFSEDCFSTSWGVSDNDLFNKSFELINNFEEPFFSTILTGSNHPPYLFPLESSFERVKNKKNKDRLNAFKYSDWALGQFMLKIRSKDIFNRTVFVILGDHGFISDDFDQNTSIELSSYHIGCLIIAPNLQPTVNNRISSQIDIIPTILDLLGGSFIHHSWGTSKLSNFEMQSDYAIMVPSGINHLAGMVQNKTFLIYNFFDKSNWFDMENFPSQYILNKKYHIQDNEIKMEDRMLRLFKSISHTLSTYKCGIEL